MAKGEGWRHVAAGSAADTAAVGVAVEEKAEVILSEAVGTGKEVYSSRSGTVKVREAEGQYHP